MMLKESARFARLLPQTLLGIVVAESVYQRVTGGGCRPTSGSDSEHKGHPIAGEDKDPHFTGRAVDLGIREVPPAIRGTLVDALGLALGPEFDILWEAKNTPNEHLHLQYTGKA